MFRSKAPLLTTAAEPDKGKSRKHKDTKSARAAGRPAHKRARPRPVDQPGRCFSCGKNTKQGTNLCSTRCSRMAAARMS